MTKIPLSIGLPPWNDSDLIAAFPEFRTVYATRPFADNAGGMKAPHAFLAWFILTRLQPDLIVESGVWKGFGTWLVERACPNADLVCLDLSFGNLEYRSSTAKYHEHDFSLVDFSDRDLTNALCFFDDHQNALMRLQQMKWKGFRRAIFEDNYPAGHGDCYSLKMIGEGCGFTPPTRPPVPLRKRLKAALDTNSVPEPGPGAVAANETHKAELLGNLDLYYEGPPLFRPAQTRWGTAWTDDRYPTKAALFDGSIPEDLAEEAEDYTWLCYVELKD